MDSELISPWYSGSWFEPAILRSFSWEQPVFLWLMLAVPLIFALRWLVRYYFNQKLPVAVSARDLRNSAANLVRLVPEILLMLVMVLLLAALARPQRHVVDLDRVIVGDEGHEPGLRDPLLEPQIVHTHVGSGLLDRGAYDLAIETLRRVKDDVKEVKAGLECGIKLQGYDDIKVGDVLEGYIRETFQRTL